MKLAQFMIVIVAALMFLIPTMWKENTAFEREEQEEAPMEELLGEQEDTFKVTYEVQTPEEENVADIYWMKEAARVAQEAGVPYFNILEQKLSKKFVEEYNRDLTVVEGVIQLDNDPMRAEYDAEEIEGLMLSGYQEL